MTSLHADEAFLGHFQLSHDPFAPRVPGFKFFPAQRKPVLGQLHHLARYSQLLLVVTGPQGSGKTLLRQALVASTNKQSVQSVVVSARGAGDAAGVLRQVAQALDVAQAEVGAILEQVVQLGLTGQEVYLLVDDAEQLDESALEALMALGAGTPEGRPHVFLFGESSLIAQLEALQLEEERFHVIELQPYTEEETREYLDQRLEGAGRGVELFTADQISDIHESSEGWPGNINQVARDALIEVMIASRSAVKRPSMGFNMPKKHVLAISAVVVVAVAAAWLMPGRSKAPTTGAPANEQAQLPLGQGAANGANPSVEFAGNTQPMPLPLVGNSQPVMRGPLAEAAGGITEGDDGVSLEGSSDTPPTVTTSAPPCWRSGRSRADTGSNSCRQTGTNPGTDADRHGQACSGHPGASCETGSCSGQACRQARYRGQGCRWQLVRRSADQQLCRADSRHQLGDRRAELRQGAGRRVPLFQESPQWQAALRDHLRQLCQS